MEREVLITADIHIERIMHDGKFDDTYSYFKDSINMINPRLFIIAGDITDSRNLRMESNEAILLQKFIKMILEECVKCGAKVIVLRGTPSHDGDIMKSLSISLSEAYDNLIYVDKIETLFVNGVSILCIPEIYTPTYEEFEKQLFEVAGSARYDMVVFHNMIDFAIPAVNQIDSKHNLSRCVVIDTDTISPLATVCVGGHVHSYIHNKNVYYTGRCINEFNQPYDKEEFGIKLVSLGEFSYNIKNIPNPHLIKYETVNIDLVSTGDEEINSIMMKYKNRKDVLYQVTFNIGDTRYKDWLNTYNPTHIKRIKNKQRNVAKEENHIKNNMSSESDVLEILKNYYKQKFGEELPDKVVELVTQEED